MHNILPQFNFDCGCLDLFINSDYEKLSSTFISKLIELNLLKVIQTDYDYINSKYEKTYLGNKICTLLKNNPDFVEDIQNIKKILYSGSEVTVTHFRKDFCCDFILTLATELQRFYQ